MTRTSVALIMCVLSLSAGCTQTSSVGPNIIEPDKNNSPRRYQPPLGSSPESDNTMGPYGKGPYVEWDFEMHHIGPQSNETNTTPGTETKSSAPENPTATPPHDRGVRWDENKWPAWSRAYTPSEETWTEENKWSKTAELQIDMFLSYPAELKQVQQELFQLIAQERNKRGLDRDSSSVERRCMAIVEAYQGMADVAKETRDDFTHKRWALQATIFTLVLEAYGTLPENKATEKQAIERLINVVFPEKPTPLPDNNITPEKTNDDLET